MKFYEQFTGICYCADKFDQTFNLSSDDLVGQFTQKHIFNGFDFNGDNVFPELSWGNPPQGIKSFAVTMYIKDVPTQNGWWHWLMFDIPQNVKRLPTNAGWRPGSRFSPGEAIQVVTDFGKPI